MDTKKDAAYVALSVLLRSGKEQTSVYDILRKEQTRLSEEDARIRARIEALSIGTIRHLLSVDYVLNHYASVKTNDMKPFIRWLLRLSVFRILFAEESADAAVTDFAVRLCAAKGYSGLKGFVNGVLRTIVREKDNIEYPSISIRYSVPEWITDILVKQTGEAEAARICAYVQDAPPLTIRLNPCASKEEIRAYPETVSTRVPGVTVQPHPLLPELAFTVSGRVYPPDLPGFSEGMLYVQDAGAMLCALLCSVKPGDRIIDVCAAPGGKALLLAQLLEKAERDAKDTRQGRVFAFDTGAAKCERIEENARRTRTGNLTVAVRDARTPDEALRETADIVLCDVPCSGLGVMARKADIRYRVRSEDIAALADLQRQIVAASVSYLKPGGVLLYCTCTLTAEENEDNARYIRETLKLSPDSLLPFLPEHLLGTPEEEAAKRGTLTLMPGRHGTDGFFIARFLKTKERV